MVNDVHHTIIISALPVCYFSAVCSISGTGRALLLQHLRRQNPVYCSVILFSVFLKDNASVVSAETECVRQRRTYFALLCCVECEVEAIVDLWIFVTLFMVDCWRYDVVLYGEHREERFSCASSSEQVSCHRLS